ncbi:MAG TPA: DUF4136 domain-containing protein [Holophagaceae bacterium]|nr:DUF4136 domain-containing protein [Holophagaceae bacterium]
MRPLRLFAVPALLLLTACSSVKYDYDVTQDFSRYRTFDLYAPGRHAGGTRTPEDTLMDKRIRAAVAGELQAKGFAREEVADPDFLVACYPVYRARRYRTRTTVGIGGGGWYRPWGYRVGTSFSQVHEYRQGSLIIEVVDARTNQLVWQGTDEGVLTDLDDPDQANDAVASAVKDTLAKFPPQARK